MKRSTKRVVGWGTGVTVGLVLVLLTFILIMAISGGTNAGVEGGKPFNLVETQAGGDRGAKNACGSYDDWVGKKLDKRALKKTGKTFRVLPPHSIVTMDHSPDRINVHVDKHGIVKAVKCG